MTVVREIDADDPTELVVRLVIHFLEATISSNGLGMNGVGSQYGR